MTRWSKSLDAHVDAAKLDAGWDRVRARRARPRALRKVAVAAPVLVLAALVLFAVRAWLAPAPPVTTLAAPTQAPIALAAITLEGGRPLPAEWNTKSAAVIPLDDGSHLEIAPKTTMRSRASVPERVELSLDDGKTTFDVKPGGPRTWIIDAADVRVEVLGTRFTVAREGTHVVVSVERGKVRVTDARGTRILTGGQSFSNDDAQATTLAPEPEKQRKKTTPVVTPTAVLAPTAPTADLAPTAPPTAGASAAPIAPSEDPMARADALRKAGRAAEAVTTLRELVDRGDRRAPLAAFTLGKVHAEDLQDHLLAARWFERAYGMGLPGGLDEEAAARAVECFAKGGARADARRAAERYEARFPNGRRIVQVRAWVREWDGAPAP